MSDINDGGPAFPVSTQGKDPEDRSYGHQDSAQTWQYPGMSKRELFAVILMHSEAVTCGVPGEACEALIEASRAAGTDVIDHMAMNAVQGADALLRALAEPKPPQYRELYASEQRQLDAAARLAQTIEDLKHDLAVLPVGTRELLERAAADVLDPEIPF